MNKEQIKSAIQNFSQGNLTENALNFFKTLDYNTERQARLDRPDYATFKDSFINDQSKFNEEKAFEVTPEQQTPIVNLVDQILAAKTTPPSAPLLSKEGNKGVIDTSAIEKQIDEMVYKLYDLTPEEIAVVEGKG